MGGEDVQEPEKSLWVRVEVLSEGGCGGLELLGVS